MIQRVPGGYKVFSKKTGEPLSKKPMTRSGALSQLRAVEASKDRSWKHMLK